MLVPKGTMVHSQVFTPMGLAVRSETMYIVGWPKEAGSGKVVVDNMNVNGERMSNIDDEFAIDPGDDYLLAVIRSTPSAASIGLLINGELGNMVVAVETSAQFRVVNLHSVIEGGLLVWEGGEAKRYMFSSSVSAERQAELLQIVRDAGEAPIELFLNAHGKIDGLYVQRIA